MVEKKKGYYIIDKLRSIILMKADFNMANKIFSERITKKRM